MSDQNKVFTQLDGYLCLNDRERAILVETAEMLFVQAIEDGYDAEGSARVAFTKAEFLVLAYRAREFPQKP